MQQQTNTLRSLLLCMNRLRGFACLAPLRETGFCVLCSLEAVKMVLSHEFNLQITQTIHGQATLFLLFSVNSWPEFYMCPQYNQLISPFLTVLCVLRCFASLRETGF